MGGQPKSPPPTTKGEGPCKEAIKKLKTEWYKREKAISDAHEERRKNAYKGGRKHSRKHGRKHGVKHSRKHGRQV